MLIGTGEEEVEPQRRHSEIAGLKVGDFPINREYDALCVVRKGGKKGSLAIHPQTVQRIKDYFAVVGHGDDVGGPLFWPVRGKRKGQDAGAVLDRGNGKEAKTMQA